MFHNIKKATSFVIDRSRWIRGEGGQESRLHRKNDGRMCCVGMYLEACGVPRYALTDIYTATTFLGYYLGSKFDLKEVGLEDLAWLYNSEVEHELYLTNDKHYDEGGNVIGAERREAVLTGLFAKAGVTVTFED